MNLTKQPTMAKARMQLTRNGVQNADAVFEFIWAKKTAWSSTCEHGWSQVKYRETRCEMVYTYSILDYIFQTNAVI